MARIISQGRGERAAGGSRRWPGMPRTKGGAITRAAAEVGEIVGAKATWSRSPRPATPPAGWPG